MSLALVSHLAAPPGSSPQASSASMADWPRWIEDEWVDSAAMLLAYYDYQTDCESRGVIPWWTGFLNTIEHRDLGIAGIAKKVVPGPDDVTYTVSVECKVRNCWRCCLRCFIGGSLGGSLPLFSLFPLVVARSHGTELS